MPNRDPTKEMFWRRVLRQWRRSGLTGRDFCAEQGLRETSFYAWRRELARRDREQQAATMKDDLPARTATARPSAAAAPPTFVQLAIADDTALTPTIEVVLTQGRRVQVRPGFDAELLRQLLRLLEEPSC
jgi:hypothetical protein